MKKLLIFKLLILMGFLGVKGQSPFTFPVQVQTIATPPYSPYLQDYTIPGRMTIKVLLNDPVKAELRVRLVLIVGGNTSCTTNLASSVKITLYKGIPVILTKPQIDTLFAACNNSGILPEGGYNMQVTAFDLTDDNLALSNPFVGIQYLQIQHPQPPLLNLPARDTYLNVMPVQNVLFQWTPRHFSTYFGSLGNPVDYTFTLVDLNKSNNSIGSFSEAATVANSVFLTNPTQSNIVVKYASNLFFPYYQLTQVDPVLEPNHYYAWRVQVKNTDLNNARSYFTNEGYSDINVFYYKSICPTVKGAKLRSDVSGYQVLTWPVPIQTDINNPITGYDVFYKRTDGTSSETSYRYDNPAAWSQELKFDFVNGTKLLASNQLYDISIQTRCTGSSLADKVFVGSVKDVPKTCDSGPQQIVIKTDTLDKKLITWEPVPSATNYLIKEKTGPSSYTYLTSVTGSDKILGTNFIMVPDPLKEYAVFAKCANGEIQGSGFKGDDLGFVGTCGVPNPLGFIASSGSSVSGTNYTINWNGSRIYEKYTFEYRKKNDLAFITQNNLLVPTTNLQLNTEVPTEYEYKITFHCSATKSANSLPGFFQTQTATSNATDPLTADCFPPANAIAEVKTNSSVEISWDKVDGAKKYLFYYIRKNLLSPKESDWTKDSTKTNKLKLASPLLMQDSAYVFYIKVVCDLLPSIASTQFGFDLKQVPVVSGTCTAVDSSEIKLEGSTQTELNISWPHKTGHLSYQVRYHDVLDPVVNWHVLEAIKIVDPLTAPKAQISGLKAGRIYEIELQPYCGTGSGDKAPKSKLVLFSTQPRPPITEGDFACGKADNIDQPDMNTCGKSALTKGKSFNAAGYDIIVLTLTGQNTGTGKMILPYANYGEARVAFRNIELDADYRLCRGVVNITGITIPELGKLADRIQAFQDDMNKAFALADEVLTVTDRLLTEAETYFVGGDNVGAVKTGDINQADFTLTNTSTITSSNYTFIPGQNGQSGKVQIGSETKDAPATIKTNDNSIYSVDKSGVPTKVGEQLTANIDTNIYKLDFSRGNAVFTEDITAKYDFDYFQDPLFKGKAPLEKEYELIQDPKTTYYVRSKFITPKSSDFVMVTLFPGTGSNALLPGKITFLNKPKNGSKAIKYNFVQTGNQFKLTLLGGPDADAQEIYIIYDNQFAIGKLLLPSYSEMSKTVVLVPLGSDITTSQITNYQTSTQLALDRIYGKVGMNWKVEVAESAYTSKSWDLNGDGKLQESGSAAFSNNYTGEERALVTEFVASLGTLPDNTAYLFVLNEAKGNNSADLLGKMPHKERVGFIYAGTGTSGVAKPGSIPILKPATEVAKTIAHEIGHGAHFLDHPFADYLKFKENATLNLMDYSGGEELWKIQWDLIHDPGHVWGIFKKDEDSQLSSSDFDKLLNWIRKNALVKTKNAAFVTSNYPLNLLSKRDFPLTYNNQTEVIFVEDLISTNCDIDVSAYNFNVDFDVCNANWYVSFNRSNTTEQVIKFKTLSYDGIALLLDKIGFNVGPNSQSLVKTKYDALLKAASNDCDKLDIIYATAPPFYLSTIPDDDKFTHLKSLSSCTLDAICVDEEQSVLNLLSTVANKSTFYSKLFLNHKLVQSLYSGLDNRNNDKLVSILTDISQSYWNANPQVLSTVSSDKDKYFFALPNFTQYGRFTAQTLEIWGVTSIGDGPAGILRIPEIKGFNALDPVLAVYTHPTTIENIAVPVPAIFIKDLADNTDVAFTKSFLFKMSNFLGAYGSLKTLAVSNASKVIRFVAYSELSLLAFQTCVDDPVVNAYIRGKDWGDEFLESYKLITIGMNLANFSFSLRQNFINNADDVSAKLRVQGKSAEADELLKVKQAIVNTVGKPDLLLKLKGYPKLTEWVSTLDDAVEGVLISKINGLNGTYYLKLEADIASVSNGPALKALIKENPDDLTDIWKVLKDDPKYGFELSKTGGVRWDKWALSNFFKAVTKAGKDFEIVARNQLQATSSVLKSELVSKYKIDLSQYEVFEQVQIKTGQVINGSDEFFVADFVLVKKNTVLGQEILDLDNAIVLETKLSSSTALTTPQTNALAKVKTTSNTFAIRSISQPGMFNSSNSLGNTNPLKITDYIKVYSDGVGTTVQDIISLK